MIEIQSAQQVAQELGQKFVKGKARGVFLTERQVVTVDELKKMTGLKFGSRQTSQQEYQSRAEGQEYSDSVSENPKYYNEQP